MDGEATAFAFVGTDNLPPGFDAEGHRGARGLLPENTLPAFEAALDLGVMTLELDLHFTQDEEVVVWHDPIIEDSKCYLPDDPADPEAPDPRNPLRRIFISQQPLSVVQSYRCDLNPDSDRFPGQMAVSTELAGNDYRIITLGELFDFVAEYANSELKTAAQRNNAATVQFNIETKRVPDSPENIDDDFTGGEAGPFELAILDLVNGRSLTDRVIIQSFDHRSLRTIREIDSEIRLAALTTGGEAKVDVYAAYKFDIWSPNKRDVTAELVAKAHNEGLVVIPWTVNETEDMQRLIGWGVDGIISDYPDRLLNLP
ncbi:glycerophosphodiester phosphodiesterase family protein [Candidatus Leptofilum sp.]|uniref:glycerophosphodiester phosphodiesterase family protein n=1 Tax=Candidatus Leptofilum sp. TaxID=3241576 RepID=UPI003B597801